MIAQAELKSLLNYDAEKGIFTWLNAKGRRRGELAGRRIGHGYIGISIRGKRYFAHRLAWFYVHGEWPPNDLDHINGNRTDNRIGNLRLATRAQNLHNMRPHSDSLTGLKGVSRGKRPGTWRARICCDRRIICLGSTFTTPELAHAAYAKASRELHGEFGRTS